MYDYDSDLFKEISGCYQKPPKPLSDGIRRELNQYEREQLGALGEQVVKNLGNAQNHLGLRKSEQLSLSDRDVSSFLAALYQINYLRQPNRFDIKEIPTLKTAVPTEKFALRFSTLLNDRITKLNTYGKTHDPLPLLQKGLLAFDAAIDTLANELTTQVRMLKKEKIVDILKIIFQPYRYEIIQRHKNQKIENPAEQPKILEYTPTPEERDALMSAWRWFMRYSKDLLPGELKTKCTDINQIITTAFTEGSVFVSFDDKKEFSTWLDNLNNAVLKEEAKRSSAINWLRTQAMKLKVVRASTETKKQ